MTLYKKLCYSSLDIRELGFTPCSPTPDTLGTTSDGAIRFCIKEDHGEMIFAVGQQTFPVAKNFADFLGLLYCCKDARLISHGPNWTNLRFYRELNRLNLTYKQRMLRNALFNGFQPPIIDDPYAYIQALQPAPVSDTNSNKTGIAAVSVPYGDTIWHVKDLISHDTGLDLQVCIELPGQRILDFHDRWDGMTPDEEDKLTMQAQDPFALHVQLRGMINGMELEPEILKTVRWDPLTDSTAEAKDLLLRYGLTKEQGWLFLSLRFYRQSKKKKNIRSLALNIQSMPVTIPGPRLTTPLAQESVDLTHPVTGNIHTFTVHTYANEGLDPNFLINPPCFYSRLCYSLSPALSTETFQIFDSLPNDRLRTPIGSASPYPDEDYENAPTADLVEPDETLPAHIRTVFSSRHYEPKPHVHWHTRFCCKLAPDAVLPIIR